jgi:hypothetical protein
MRGVCYTTRPQNLLPHTSVLAAQKVLMNEQTCALHAAMYHYAQGNRHCQLACSRHRSHFERKGWWTDFLSLALLTCGSLWQMWSLDAYSRVRGHLWVSLTRRRLSLWFEEVIRNLLASLYCSFFRSADPPLPKGGCSTMFSCSCSAKDTHSVSFTERVFCKGE